MSNSMEMKGKTRSAYDSYDESDEKMVSLVDTHQLIVKQKPKTVQMFSWGAATNVYDIFNDKGDVILKAVEIRDEMVERTTCMCFGRKPFHINIVNSNSDILLSARAEDSRLARKVTVECPIDNIVAIIEEPFSWLKPVFYLYAADGTFMFQIPTPLVASFGSWDQAKFDILAYDKKTKIGKITKDWSGLAQELFTDVDTFALNVPVDMDVTWKAALLTVLFLIDFTFYEEMS